MARFFNEERSGRTVDIKQEIENLDKLRNKVTAGVIDGTKLLLQSGHAYYRGNNSESYETGVLALDLLLRAEGHSPNDIGFLLVKARNLLANNLTNMGRREEGYRFHLQNLQLLQQRKNLEDLAVCYNNVGYYHLMRGEYLAASKYLEDAQRTIKQLEQQPDRPAPEQLRVLKRIFNENTALTLIRRGEYGKARGLLEEDLKSAERDNDLSAKVKIIHDLGIIRMEQGYYDNAMSLFLQARDLSRETSNERRMAMVLGDLAELHSRLGRVREGSEWITECIRLFNANKNEEDIVKRYCQLFEFSDLLAKEDEEEVISHINHASRLAIQHESEEELLLTNFYLASRFFRHNHIDLSLMLFDSMYSRARVLGNHQLIASCEMYLSAIQISYFLESGTASSVQKAKEYISSIIADSRKECLTLSEIRGLYLSSIAKICTSDIDQALLDLGTASSIAKETENHLVVEKIDTLLHDVSMLKVMSSSSTQYTLPDFFILRHGARSFLQEFMLWTNLDKVSRKIENFGYILVIQEESGPAIAYQSSDTGVYASEDELVKSSVSVTLAIGQGSGYHQGLFGPFPINERSNGLIFSLFVPDSRPVYLTRPGKNFVLYVLLLFANSQIGLRTREKLTENLKESFSVINDI
ncbi:MAG TPA: tetratricopeptide repeat protein, partial [Candidatus Hodarchaeales archaeon]|nr:tetratricopeptide repeat protein [Candidatus Hodarchaeales archaeon]